MRRLASLALLALAFDLGLPSAARSREIDYADEQAPLYSAGAEDRLARKAFELSASYSSCSRDRHYRSLPFLRGVRLEQVPQDVKERLVAAAPGAIPPAEALKLVASVNVEPTVATVYFRDGKRELWTANWYEGSELATEPAVGKWLPTAGRSGSDATSYSQLLFVQSIQPSRELPAVIQDDLNYASCFLGSGPPPSKIPREVRSLKNDEEHHHPLLLEFDRQMQAYQEAAAAGAALAERRDELLQLTDSIRSQGLLPYHDEQVSSMQSRRPRMAQLYSAAGRHAEAIDLLWNWFMFIPCGNTTTFGLRVRAVSREAAELGDWHLFLWAALAAVDDMRFGFDEAEEQSAVEASVEALQRFELDLVRLLLGMMWRHEGGPSRPEANPSLVGGLLAASQDAELGTFRLLMAAGDARLDPWNRVAAVEAVAYQGYWSRQPEQRRIWKHLRDLRIDDPHVASARDGMLDHMAKLLSWRRSS